jgi:hypothetical protein
MPLSKEAAEKIALGEIREYKLHREPDVEGPYKLLRDCKYVYLDGPGINKNLLLNIHEDHQGLQRTWAVSFLSDVNAAYQEGKKSTDWEAFFAGWLHANHLTMKELGLGFTGLGGENQLKEAFREWSEKRSKLA